ncbi:hypothetical protein MMC10_009265 [Thelotrema lepadinum]|nr:hypothetical protein [Thelotrema lepadinum]
MASTTYLITGANRGIGLGLVTVLLSRPNTTVIAAVRSPSSTASLSSLPKASGSKLIIVKIDAKVTSDPAAAVTELKSTHNLTQIDVVIANAGISNHYVPAATTSIAEAQEHYEVNFLGPLALFQATLPLLEKSANPKFVGVSTGAATIGNMDKWPVPVTAYGASKVALNFFLRKASMEHPGIVIYPIHPG